MALFATVAPKVNKPDQSLLSEQEYNSIHSAHNPDISLTYQSVDNTPNTLPTSSLKSSTLHSPSKLSKITRRKSTIYSKVSHFSFRSECPVISIFVLYTFLTFLFAGIGGVLFHVCEFDHEDTQILQKRELYDQLSTALKSVNESYIAKLDQILEMCEIPTDLNKNRWELQKSIFFAFTTASTIGYGYTTPSTFMGKACTFLYGLPAIIIFGLAMIQIGHAIVNKIDKGASDSYIGQIWIYNCKNCSFCTCLYNTCCKNCSIELQRTICIFILLSGLVCLSAWSMEDIESDWSFVDGMYFMWISISTIGYGDLEPSAIQSSYWANGLVWLGLALTAILIGSSQDYFQMKVKNWRAERLINRQRDIMLSAMNDESRDSFSVKEASSSKGNPPRVAVIEKEIRSTPCTETRSVLSVQDVGDY